LERTLEREVSLYLVV